MGRLTSAYENFAEEMMMGVKSVIVHDFHSSIVG